jgi:DNA invertase Pin-like site-specific DNA recombinase
VERRNKNTKLTEEFTMTETSKNTATGTKPRIVLLYRVSSKKQSDQNNDCDIPLQRDILKPWAERQGYEFICEKIEGGVSGYKVRAADRDAIIEIKAMADRKEFDILGIYTSDRLGRIAEETPLIVSYLNARNIRVISYTEGEINSATHSDKLMTYIRYWQAEGESLKTSMRVADSLTQSVIAGKWRGGLPPYGYHSVSRGTLNFKGKPIFDVEIEPAQAEVVKTIFSLYTKEYYGSRAIAKYLNDKGIPTRENCLWSGSQVLDIIKNKMYTGVYVLHKWTKNKPQVESPVMPNLVIIDGATYDKAQRMIRSNTQNPDAKKPTLHGTLMLAGLLYCGECGRKFTSHRYTVSKKRTNGESYIYDAARYRCSSFTVPMEREERCHQKLYKTKELEAIVIRDAKKFISKNDREKLLRACEDTIGGQIREIEEKLRKWAREVSQKEKEIQKLKDEVVKVVMGESDFSQSLLTELVQGKESELSDIRTKHSAAITARDGLAEQLAVRKCIAADLDNWSERFDMASDMEKKAMLINIIDRITVYPDRLSIDYKLEVNPLTDIIPIDKPDWAAMGDAVENSTNSPNVGLSHTTNCVNSLPQARSWTNGFISRTAQSARCCIRVFSSGGTDYKTMIPYTPCMPAIGKSRNASVSARWRVASGTKSTSIAAVFTARTGCHPRCIARRAATPS